MSTARPGRPPADGRFSLPTSSRTGLVPIYRVMNVTIYTTDWCPSCDAAKRVLEREGIAYEEIDIESWDDPRGRLESLTGRRTVPQVVAGGTVIGGFTDLMQAVRSERLADLLAA